MAINATNFNADEVVGILISRYNRLMKLSPENLCDGGLRAKRNLIKEALGLLQDLGTLPTSLDDDYIASVLATTASVGSDTQLTLIGNLI